MSTQVTVPTTAMTLAQKFGFTESQLDLIKRTVAKNATDDELELFFYRAQALKANPLMPGQIYFVKFGNSAGTIIVGIDTFRNHAHSTGKLAGVKRGVIRDKNGACIGGWCDVYRTDWKEPAHEEVPISEYNTGKGNWQRMPETMIKKVAEVAAYRMAFPQQLGGLYVHEEMEKVTKTVDSEVVPERAISQAQLARLFAIAKSAGINSKEELKEKFNIDKSLTELTLDEYDTLCERVAMYEAPIVAAPIAAPIAETQPKEVESTELPWEKYLK